MEFQYLNNVLYFLPVLGALVILWMGSRKKRNIPTQLNMAGGPNYLAGLLLALGLILVAVAIMGPRQEDGIREIPQEGLDIYVLMDTSKSMTATDIVPSRMDRAKKIVDEIMVRLDGDRIGFIPYASSAYIQMPLTDDYDLARMYLDVMDTDMIGGGGTDVLQAVELAARSFDQVSGGQQVILILSDGEAHDMDYGKLADYEEKSDFRIYAIGIGSEEGSLIPLTDPDTGDVTSYKKDAAGDPITTRLDESQLKKLAADTNGRYYRSDVSEAEIPALIRDLGYLQRGNRSPAKFKVYKEKYQWFLLLGITALLAGLMLPERRRSR